MKRLRGLRNFVFMNTLRLLQMLLVVHLAGLTLMAGTTVVSFISFKNLSRAMPGTRDLFNYYFAKMLGLSGLLVAGGILLVLSGAGLLILTHAYGQLWFQVKMGLVLALVLNGFLFGGRQELRIRKVLEGPDGWDILSLRQPIVNLRTFYAIQMSLFLGVVVLAVVKPG
jgi:hypothetical protein